ncbi:MAG: NAD(P)-binding domain-containing protein [Pseudomonadota bacterium]
MSGIGPRSDEEHRQVVFFTEEETGLRGILALDDDRLGPCVGACRSRPYVDKERATADAIRQGMTTTAKALLAGLPVGGGCMALLSDSSIGIRAASPMPAISRIVDKHAGRYLLLPDLQGDLHDMNEAAGYTRHVLGQSGQHEIDSVEATALGLRIGIEAAVHQQLGRDHLMGVRIGIMGLGSVGFRLAELLRQEGARLTVADRDPMRTERAVRALGINCVATEEIIHIDVDVFVPTAAKDTIDEGVLSHLRCKVLAGAVDDPLRTPTLGAKLHERGILYAPDIVINAGGLISLARPLSAPEMNTLSVLDDIKAIGPRMAAIAKRSAQENLPTTEIVTSMVEDARAARVGSGTAEMLAS